MSTSVARPVIPVAVDPRMAAFLAPDCPEVFHSVATPTAIWKADPYDVETIHAEARAAFEHLLNRGPDSSASVRSGLGIARRSRQRQDALDAGVSHACSWPGVGLLRIPSDDE